MQHLVLFVLLLVFIVGLPEMSAAEFYRFDSAEKWSSWQLPTGLVEINEADQVEMVKFRKNIDPVRDAGNFVHQTLTGEQVSGGIWRAGSRPETAFRIIDDDPLTYWQPDPADPLAKWEVEIDLGRVVLSRRITSAFRPMKKTRGHCVSLRFMLLPEQRSIRAMIFFALNQSTRRPCPMKRPIFLSI
jgi:hypothetical protein